MNTKEFYSNGEFVNQAFSFIPQMVSLIRAGEINAVKYQQAISELLNPLINETPFVVPEQKITTDENSIFNPIN